MNLLNGHLVERIRQQCLEWQQAFHKWQLLLCTCCKAGNSPGDIYPGVFCSDSNYTGFYHSLFSKVARQAGSILTPLTAPADKGTSLKDNTPEKTEPQAFMGGSQDSNKTRKEQIPKQTNSLPTLKVGVHPLFG